MSENTKGSNNPFFGKKHSEKTKKQMSENNAMKKDLNGLRNKHRLALKGRKRPNQSEFMKENNPTKDKEVCKKISKSLTGKKKSESRRKNMSIFGKLAQNKPEVKAKKSKTMKSIFENKKREVIYEK